jgi:hypothetical protein
VVYDDHVSGLQRTVRLAIDHEVVSRDHDFRVTTGREAIRPARIWRARQSLRRRHVHPVTVGDDHRVLAHLRLNASEQQVVGLAARRETDDAETSGQRSVAFHAAPHT